jgi:hypothetical protein
LVVAALVLVAGCAAPVKGRIVGDFYIPPRGNFKCEILGGAEYGTISERYSDFGGLVHFQDDMFAYRVDFQTIEGAPYSVPNDVAALDLAQKRYLHKQAVPLTLHDRPGGVLVKEGPEEANGRRVYVGLLHYDKAGRDATLAATGPHYKAVAVLLSEEFAYTVTTDDVDRSNVGQPVEKNMRDAIEKAVGQSTRCVFGGQF